MATLRLGSKIICPIKIAKQNGTTLSVIPSTTTQTFSGSYGEVLVNAVKSNIDANISNENIKNNIIILGITGNADTNLPQYYINKSLNADGKLVNKTSDLIDFISVGVLDTACLAYAYYNDYSLTGDIAFTNIYQIKSKALSYAFVNTNINTLYFPSLTSSSFGTDTDQFHDMLKGCVNVTVHFPIGLEATIGKWADTLAGFGGVNTTILYDLSPSLDAGSVDYPSLVDKDAGNITDTVVVIHDAGDLEVLYPFNLADYSYEEDEDMNIILNEYTSDNPNPSVP